MPSLPRGHVSGLEGSPDGPLGIWGPVVGVRPGAAADRTGRGVMLPSINLGNDVTLAVPDDHYFPVQVDQV